MRWRLKKKAERTKSPELTTHPAWTCSGYTGKTFGYICTKIEYTGDMSGYIGDSNEYIGEIIGYICTKRGYTGEIGKDTRKLEKFMNRTKRKKPVLQDKN